MDEFSILILIVGDLLFTLVPLQYKLRRGGKVGLKNDLGKLTCLVAIHNSVRDMLMQILFAKDAHFARHEAVIFRKKTLSC